ncbi:MAG: NAD(P)/FAD-dependent oxidoreductase [Pseudomonadota bacterium]
MPLDLAETTLEQTDIVNDWLAAFEGALTSGDAVGIARLFADDCHWRDVVAFQWDIRTVSGCDAVVAALVATSPSRAPKGFHIPDFRARPRRVVRGGVACIEALFGFETRHGRAAGVLRLVDGGAQAKAWILATTLDDLSGHGIDEGQSLPADAFSRDFGGDNWLDKRNARDAFADREPTVVVVGAGQAGLGISARLTALGVDTLLIDAHERIGDNWRKRYHSLTLHNEAHVNHLPYLPFPKTFPVFIPKDKLANWFESYADIMDLSVWAGTRLVAGSYDDDDGRWSLTLDQGARETRTVRPRHLVFATGVSSIPIMPNVKGLDTFAGELMHSGQYTDGADWSGRRALVLGTGNSAHDVAQDLHASGADVTMVQRSSSYIVSLEQAQKVYAIYDEGPSVDDCDLITTASPYPFLERAYKLSTAEMKIADKALHDRLRTAGFQLDYGAPDDTGFQMKYLRRGGGYYFNVGCSDLIASGEIKLVRADTIETYTADGARLTDGSTIKADLIVAATGYKNQQETVRAYLGDDVADRVGQVWGFDAGGELANMWRPTPQPGLWFTAGSLAQCRIYSKYLALQIAAQEAGVV